MRRLFLVLSLILLALVFLNYLTKKPFAISKDMAFADSYLKKNVVSDHDQVFTTIKRYTPQHLSLLNSISPDELQNFRCSDEFIRTNQGIYILKNIKTSQKYKKIVKNSEFIEFMRDKEKNMPQGKKILTVRLCETKNNDLLIFYSIGKYDSSNVDNSTILQTVYSSIEDEAHLQIFPKGRSFGSKSYLLEKSNNYLYCNEPFQITNNNALYILCSSEAYKKSSHFILDVDLNTGSKKNIGKCINDYREELKTTCN